MSDQHSPLPWRVNAYSRDGFEIESTDTLTLVVRVKGQLIKQDAEFIVRACNSHAALVEALKHAIDVLDEDGCDCGDANDPPCALCEARRALKLAGAE